MAQPTIVWGIMGNTPQYSENLPKICTSVFLAELGVEQHPGLTFLTEASWLVLGALMGDFP